MFDGFDGTKLRQVRMAKGMRQNALARTAGVSKSYLNDLEKGRASPSIECFVRLSEALGESDMRIFLKTEFKNDKRSGDT